MLKNTVFKTAGHALGVPNGTSSVGPDHAVNGQTRFNTTNSQGKLEFYGNITGSPSWNAIAREGNVLIVKDSFTGNGTQTMFGPMTYSYASGREAQALIHAGTVYQIPGTNYSFFGNNYVNFSSAPSNGAAITIIHNLASTISSIA